MRWFGGSVLRSEEDLRRIWFARQGLAARAAWSVPQCIARTGWLRAFGGTAYVSLRARIAPFTRADADTALAVTGAVASVPSVRACVMLVPLADVPLSLAVAAPGVAKDVNRIARRCGVELDEIERLGKAIVAALAAEPLTVDALRERVPPGSVRALGDVGRKLGDATTLSVALRWLAGAGRVRRLPDKQRLDSPRILYALPAADATSAAAFAPLMGAEPDEEQIAPLLLERFLGFASPATVAECARWTGFGKKAVKSALERLAVRTFAVGEEEYVALEGDPFLERRPTLEQSIALLPADDNLPGFRASVRTLLPEKLQEAEIGGQRVAYQRWLTYHQIYDAGALIGAWEYDPDRERVTWGCFGKVAKARRALIAEQADALFGFIREELGDLKMASIDNKKARDARIKAIDALSE